MTDDPLAIQTKDLGKCFKIYSGLRGRVADWVLPGSRQRYQEFWALRNITLDIRKGEAVGIIGPNGAGKTTLLKLLTGALHPTLGLMELHGTVLSLLELGTGFHPELTGRQNVENSASLLNFPPDFALQHMDQIQAFAGLGNYFDRPVKHYSSGMFVRLAFSLFSAMEPDIFLVDEALAVGDLRFVSRALQRVRELLNRGMTMLFVSHNLEIINQLCTRVLWLHEGEVVLSGSPSEVIPAYIQFVVHGDVEQRERRHSLSEQDEGQTLDPDVANELAAMQASFKRYPPIEAALARFKRVVTRGKNGEIAVRFVSGDPIDLEITVEALYDVQELAMGVEIRDVFNRLIWGTRTDWGSKPLRKLGAGQNQTVRFSTPALGLGKGLYRITVAIGEGRFTEITWQRIDGAWQFEILDKAGANSFGLVDLSLEWDYLDGDDV